MDRVINNTQHLDSFLADINTFASEQLNAAEMATFPDFSQQFFARYPLDELRGRHLGDVFGMAYHAWRFLQNFDRQAPKIQVFNPNLEEHGWLCPHTVLMVLQCDMPFLVDSIRMELNRRNIAIHAIKSTVMTIERDTHHKLLGINVAAQVSGDVSDERLKQAASNQGKQKEAVIVMEIRQHTNESDLSDLRASIASVLLDVDVVVADYLPMRSVAEQVATNLAQVESLSTLTGVSESLAFLRWLIDNHFTFLGYREYEFATQGGVKILREQADKRLGIFRLKGGEATETQVDELNAGVARFHLTPQVITFSKSSVRARVHRQAYSDYVVVKRFNSAGEVCGEARFLGLYTSAVYTLNPAHIPLLRDKVAKVFDRSGLDPAGHDGKALQQILDTFPREELLLASSSELYETVTGVARINERYMVRLFMRPDTYGKFISCLVYVPRDVFTTKMRLRIQALIGAAIGSDECEFITSFSESILARVYMVFKVNPGQVQEYDIEALQAQIVDITRTWDDHLQEALLEALGEEKALALFDEYRAAFSTAYKETFSARAAVHDIATVVGMNDHLGIAMNFYQLVNAPAHQVRFKIFQRDHHLELSDVIPVLEHLGLRVLAENSYDIRTKNNAVIWLHDFQLNHTLADNIDIHAIKQNFQDAFAAIWARRADSDGFNRLVLSARLNWREVVLLRAYASYMHQTLFNFTQSYVANALVSQFAITRNLVALFKAKFDPRLNSSGREKNAERIERLRQKIIDALDAVQNLSEDRILRRYLMLIDGSLRTNYFQQDSNQQDKDYLSIKLSPRTIPDIPEPRPLYEIFVYSPRVEGVHLRGGRVARGGLRWSDRQQDYRTEVLGLVKAQQVKNAVIVPNGAKGGFVCKQQMPGASRDEIQQEAIDCYKIFIRGLLDLTDNLVDGETVPPRQAVCFDDVDPYMVVAADKGTATFSDIANSISAEYNFWLGDAFASGGSQGYDHKSMGITARGAWISVQRHFKEKGINTQQQDFTVIGVGDMAGDVFGNGMLLSPHICLVAAFNHQHIFIDPTPDAAKSLIERERLFNLPRSSWADYDKTLISAGGGIFNRDAKSIVITPEMKDCFAIAADRLTPNELIHALLKAPVDLLWNGGIGTYVKSTEESHSDVGDKANDAVRVNGSELRAKVVGEGGNLGMTQRGRIEYCLNGGACNTDFIDNVGGVDCSDHEVNVKILLNEVVSNGDMTQKQRNQLLAAMTDNVAQLVLHNSYRQTQAISIAQADVIKRGAEYRRFMNTLQNQGRLNRKLEFLPEDETLLERQALGKGLTRPELAILISYAKAVLKEELAVTDIAEDPYIARFIEGAFPQKICHDYREPLYRHRLRREIVATQIANDIVNNMGISFAQRLAESTGASSGELALAYVTARDIFQLDEYWSELEALDYQIPAALQIELMTRMMRRVRRATRWFLRNRRGQIQPAKEVKTFTAALQRITEKLPRVLRGQPLQQWQESCESLMAAGLPEPLAQRSAVPGYLFFGLGFVDSAIASDKDIVLVSQLYSAVSEYLDLPWFAQQISDVKVENYWQAMARESYMDDLEAQLRTLVARLVINVNGEDNVDTLVEAWGGENQLLLKRWKGMITELQSSAQIDFAVFSVALRELRDLVA